MNSFNNYVIFKNTSIFFRLGEFSQYYFILSELEASI